MDTTIKRGKVVDLTISNQAPDAHCIEIEVGEWKVSVWKNGVGQTQVDVSGGRNDIETHMILGEEE